MDKLVLGLGGSAHDFSSVIMEEENLVCGIEDERVTRRKHGRTWWYEIPCLPSTDYCLGQLGKTMEAVKTIVACDIMPSRIEKYYSNIVYYGHHLLHAASLYYFTPHENIGILVIDGWGSIVGSSSNKIRTRETISFYKCARNRLELLGRTIGEQPIENNSFSMGISNSLGYFYSMITRLAGFGKEEEGKLMGLAGYGEPKFFESMMKHVELGTNYSEAFLFDPMDGALVKMLQEKIFEAGDTFQVKADLAASGQLVFEHTLDHLISLLERENVDSFGIVGGCALNSVANGKIDDALQLKNKELIVLPHAGDAGIALGAAAFHQANENRNKSVFSVKDESDLRRVYSLSWPYSNNQILNAINTVLPRIEYEVLAYPASRIAKLLSGNEVIAFFCNSGEFGPRALGNRSLLASPASFEAKAKLNRQIKFREPFRPIAPVVLDKYYQEYFEGNPIRHFMLKVAKARTDRAASISSVVHVDGTARVQSLSQDINPLLYEIIEHFNEITGIPVLCNTSFNLKGEPIVETPVDALRTFMQMSIKYLYLDGFLIAKP